MSDLQAPHSPINLTASFVGKSPGPAMLTWTAVIGAINYTVQKKLNDSEVFLTVARRVKTAQWLDIARLAAPGTQYQVAVNTDQGTSPFSAPVTL